MKPIHFFIAVIVIVASRITAEARGSFQNLGFESAKLSPIPNGQGGGEVPIAEALPGWTAYLGNTEISQVLQNNFTLGNASVDILGPDWPSGGIIEGQYTVVLQPGVDPFGSGQNVTASISQTGLVPANTESLQFKGQISTDFSVILDGQSLSVVPLETGANYTLYGADIPTSDAGQSETLTITALAAPNNADAFDSFVFSPSTVPEPNTLALLLTGGVTLSLHHVRRKRR